MQPYHLLPIAAPWRLHVAVPHGSEPEDRSGDGGNAEHRRGDRDAVDEPREAVCRVQDELLKIRKHVDRIIDQCYAVNTWQGQYRPTPARWNRSRGSTITKKCCASRRLSISLTCWGGFFRLATWLILATGGC